MIPGHPPRRFAGLVVLGAVAALAAGGALLYRQAIHRPAPPPAGAGVEPGPAAIEEALAGLDSLALKSRWVDHVPGVDVDALEPARREVFLRFANARRCTCGCGYTLAACRNYDVSCDVSGPLAVALFDSVRAGLVGSARGVRERPDSGG